MCIKSFDEKMKTRTLTCNHIRTIMHMSTHTYTPTRLRTHTKLVTKDTTKGTGTQSTHLWLCVR